MKQSLQAEKVKDPHVSKASSLNLMLLLFETETDHKTYPAILLDLSINGASLVVGSPVNKDTKLKLQLELSKNEIIFINGTANATRPLLEHSETNAHFGNYILQVTFEELPRATSDLIVSYVCTRLLSELEEEPVERVENLIQNRRYQRAPLTLTIFCKDQKHTPFSIVTLDLSGGGTHFQAERKINAGELLNLQIQLDLSVPTITTTGKVIWVRKLDEENYEGGLEFSDLSSDFRKIIVQYVADSLKQLSTNNQLNETP